MRLDLDGIGIELQAERLDEAAVEVLPVNVRVSRHVGVVVAYGTIELGGERHGGNLGAAAYQSRRNVGYFLAERGWCGRLAVGAGEHRQLGQLVRQFAQTSYHAVEFRQQASRDSVLQHQRV